MGLSLPPLRVPGPLRGLLYRTYARNLQREIARLPVPRHVGFIMDGNRRFAKALGRLPWEGHELGAHAVEALVGWGREVGVRTMTLYAFSTENFSRPGSEVDALMALFATRLAQLAEDERIHADRVAVRVLGRTERLPADVLEAVQRVESATKDYEAFRLNFCIAYGGRQEILDAVRAILAGVEAGEIRAEDLDEELFGRHLYTGGDDPDLIIRTGGESRLSNFLLYQAAYSELFFTDVYFPSFRKIDFLRVIRAYQQRQRRYGR